MAVQQLPRRSAQRNVPRSDRGVNKGEPIRLDFAPLQATSLAWPASGPQGQPHGRNAVRALVFEGAQHRARLCQTVGAEKPPALRTAVEGEAGAGVSGACGRANPLFCMFSLRDTGATSAEDDNSRAVLSLRTKSSCKKHLQELVKERWQMYPNLIAALALPVQPDP